MSVNCSQKVVAIFLTLICGLTCYFGASRNANTNLNPKRVQSRPPQEATRKSSVYNARIDHIQAVCEKYGPALNGYSNMLRNNMLVSRSHSIGYCKLAKVGLTTWLAYFLQLSNVGTSRKIGYSRSVKSLHSNVPKMFKLTRIGQKTLKKIFKFSFVRHPFERLISAYENKILGWRELYGSHYTKVHRRLMEKYGNISFPSFIHHILSSQRFDASIGLIKPNDCHINVHWRPYYCRCGYCDLQYDFIGKMETFEKDVKELSQKERLKKYISQLSAEAKLELYNHYKADFELFDYSVEEYF